MPTLVQNAAKCEKRDVKHEKSKTKYPAIRLLFFAFHDHFCIFLDKGIAGLTTPQIDKC